MTEFIEFDYETVDGKILTIEGEKDRNKINFKARLSDTNIKYARNLLSDYDVENIEEIIQQDAKEFEELSDTDYLTDE